MGRRKVDPSKRLRAVQACLQYVPHEATGHFVLACIDSDFLRGDNPSQYASKATEQCTRSKVYIGPAASLSFLQLVRETVAKGIGSSEFSNPATRDQMLEAELRSNFESTTNFEITWTKRVEYANGFLAATRGLLGLLSKSEIMSLVEKHQVYTADDVSYSSAVACLILAIGAQCSVHDSDSIQTEKVSLACAQKIAFSGRLEDPCLEMIQTFLLLAFYMLGACRRNAAFMYLGVAARAAFALGLHNSDCDRLMPPPVRESSSRAWRSIVNLDLIISSILGRTAATSGPKARDEQSSILADPEMVCLQSSFQLSILVEDIINSIYQSNGSSITVAEQYLSLLKQWSSNLPSEVRISTKPQETGEDVRAQVVGSFHLSCYYHFAVMLVSRPFLISHLVAGSAAPATGRRISISSLDSSNANASRMADICVRAAVLMAQTCADVVEAGFLMENMCIVKAWIFAAGLVLGFQSFAAQKADLEVDEAFMGARNVLQRLAIRSMQAAHYADILKHLANAITERRRRMVSSRQERRDGMVDKILNLRAVPEHSEKQQASDAAISSQNVDAPPTGLYDVQDMDSGTHGTSSADFDSSMLGLDSASFQFWDQFLFDHQAMYNWTEADPLATFDPPLAGLQPQVHYPP